MTAMRRCNEGEAIYLDSTSVITVESTLDLKYPAGFLGILSECAQRKDHWAMRGCSLYYKGK